MNPRAPGASARAPADPLASEAGDVFGRRDREPVVVDVDVAAQLVRLIRDGSTPSSSLICRTADVERSLHVAGSAASRAKRSTTNSGAHLGRLRHLVEHRPRKDAGSPSTRPDMTRHSSVKVIGGRGERPLG